MWVHEATQRAHLDRVRVSVRVRVRVTVRVRVSVRVRVIRVSVRVRVIRFSVNRVRVSVRMRGDVPRAAIMGARVIGVAYLAPRGTQRLVALSLVRVRVGGRFRFGVRLRVRN